MTIFTTFKVEINNFESITNTKEVHELIFKHYNLSFIDVVGDVCSGKHILWSTCTKDIKESQVIDMIQLTTTMSNQIL